MHSVGLVYAACGLNTLVCRHKLHVTMKFISSCVMSNSELCKPQIFPFDRNKCTTVTGKCSCHSHYCHQRHRCGCCNSCKNVPITVEQNSFADNNNKIEQNTFKCFQLQRHQRRMDSLMIKICYFSFCQTVATFDYVKCTTRFA